MKPIHFFFTLLTLFVIGCVVLLLYVNSCVSTGMPSLEQLENPKQNLATQVFSSDDVLLDHFFVQKRVNLKYDEIPTDFVNALVATEDKNFYKHWGVHAMRVVKAAVKNVRAGQIEEGASTITMQLAQNLFLTRERRLCRKIKEAFLAVQIEKTYTKQEIIERYANTVVFGRGAYGLLVASQLYFDKEPSELTTAECAFLVGILKAPEHYNGLQNYDKAKGRRDLVLRLMYDQKYLKRAEFIAARKEPINLGAGRLKKGRESYSAPHFVEMIRQSLTGVNSRNRSIRLREYDLYRDGLNIETTLNSLLQIYAEEAVAEQMKEFQARFDRSWSWSRNQKLLNTLISEAVRKNSEYQGAETESERIAVAKKLRADKSFVDSVKNAATTVQVGFLAIDPRNGNILAMVGAAPKFMDEHPDARYSFNHAYQSKRQPGSSFKPFVYASSLKMGLTPETMIECGPFEYETVTGEIWKPRGTGGCEEGEMTTLAKALRLSINTVSARLITEVTTPQKVIALADRMGIESKLDPVPALALGAGGDVSLLEMTSAFGTFANDGVHVQSSSVTKIEDRDGRVLYERRSPGRIRALQSDEAKLMVEMMEGVIQSGTAWRVKQHFTGVDCAGKTGTTNDNADAWFIGYTPQLVAGVWLGFDDKRITFTGGYGEGGKAAAPIWARFMRKVYSDGRLPYNQKKFFFAADTLDSAFTASADSLSLESELNSSKTFSDRIDAGSGSRRNNLPDLEPEAEEPRSYEY